MKTTAQKIEDLLLKGKRPGDIANRLKVSQSYVYNIKKQMNRDKLFTNDEELTPSQEHDIAELKVEAEELRDLVFRFNKDGGWEVDDKLTDMVNNPPHYRVGGIETIDFIEAKGLSYHLGNVVKYISRSGHKEDTIEDLKKAKWYLDRAIEVAEFNESESL